MFEVWITQIIWISFLILLYVIKFQLQLVDETYEIHKYFENKHKNSSQLSSEAELASDMHSAAQDLVNYYVRVEGLAISQVSNLKLYLKFKLM